MMAWLLALIFMSWAPIPAVLSLRPSDESDALRFQRKAGVSSLSESSSVDAKTSNHSGKKVMISTSERGQLQSESTNPEVDENDGKEFSTVCTDCVCKGTENKDYKSLGSAASALECMRLVKADTTSFCGSEFVVVGGDDNNCWCRAADKPCPKSLESGSGWSVYRMQAIDQEAARETAVDKSLGEVVQDAQAKKGSVELTDEEILRLQNWRKEKDEAVVRKDTIKTLEQQLEAASKLKTAEGYQQCAKLQSQLEVLRAEDKKSDERMAEMQKAEARYNAHLKMLEDSRDLAAKSKDFGVAADYQTKIDALTAAYQASTSQLSKYKFTQKGCKWLEAASREKYGNEAVEVIAPNTRLNSDIMTKINDIKQASIQPDNLVHEGLLVKDAEPVASAGACKQSEEDKAALDSQAAAQLQSTDMKGIMKSAGGFIFEATISSLIPPLDEVARKEFELRLRLLSVPKMHKQYKVFEDESRKNIGETGILKFGESNGGKWWGNQKITLDNYEKKPTFQGDEKKYSFKGKPMSASVKWLADTLQSDFLFRFEQDDQGVYACDITKAANRGEYIFRVEAARIVAGPATSLANVYVGMYSEGTSAEKKVWKDQGGTYQQPNTWWFQAKLDRGLMDKDAGKLEYRCLRSGLEKYSNFTGVVGTERFIFGEWESNCKTYHVGRTDVNVPFLAETNKGHRILFNDGGTSGIPEAQLVPDIKPGQVIIESAILPMYALWAPQKT